MLDVYFSSVRMKDSKRTLNLQTMRLLLEQFGPDRLFQMISSRDVDKRNAWLLARGYSPGQGCPRCRHRLDVLPESGPMGDVSE